MEIKTEQLKFDLGMVAQTAQKQLKEVLSFLHKEKKNLSGVTFKDDNDNLLYICRINPDLSLEVREFDDEPNTFEIYIDNIDAYEVISLLDYIKDNVLEK